MSTMAQWRLVLRTYPCDTCLAEPGEPCVTDAGHVTQEHVARSRDIGRCPKCGSWVGRDDEPGALCTRCLLLRDLNTERARTHRRADP